MTKSSLARCSESAADVPSGNNGASPVSRDHSMPPLVTTPEPARAKETRRRRAVGNMRHRCATGEPDEADDIDDIPRPPPRSSQSPVRTPIEAAERHIPSPSGKLSADTLKVMLEAQEATTKDETPS
jgi:hypothetical protein